MPQPPQLRVRADWITITVTGTVEVITSSSYGYAPVLPVRNEATGQDYILYIAAKSIMEHLEPLRKNNGGEFKGLRFSIRKESENQMAKYELKTD